MKKIMFNDKYGLTQAVLEGRKTMTRRAISEDVWQRADVYRHKYYEDTLGLLPAKKALIEFSPFKPGEVVAVAQSLRDMGYDPSKKDWGRGIIWGLEKTPQWTNKMFVSASECIHQIRIMNVRVERLQDISDADCMREGIMEGEFMNTWDTFYYDKWGEVPNHITFKSPREAFAALIDKVYGRGTWQANPYCFCYTFELVK